MLGRISCASWPFHIFFKEVQFWAFVPCLIQFVFFLLVCESSLDILDMSPLSDMCIWNVFSRPVARLSLLRGKQECFILVESLVPTLCGNVIWVLAQNSACSKVLGAP